MFVTTGYHNKKIEALEQRYNLLITELNEKLSLEIKNNTNYINELKTKEVQTRVDKLPKKLMKKLVEVESGYPYDYLNVKYTGQVFFYVDPSFGAYFQVPRQSYQISIDELETKIERMKKLKCK